MEDNIIIEEIEYTDELYQKNIQEDQFTEDETHGIGVETDGNS